MPGAGNCRASTLFADFRPTQRLDLPSECCTFEGDFREIRRPLPAARIALRNKTAFPRGHRIREIRDHGAFGHYRVTDLFDRQASGVFICALYDPGKRLPYCAARLGANAFGLKMLVEAA